MEIKKGQRVWILPEYQDEGDENLTWVALEDSADERGEMPRIDIGTLESQNMAFPPRHRVRLEMITTENTGDK